MTRKEGDLCPHCKKGQLTVHPDREVRAEPSGNTASHRTWLCDSCGMTCRDFIRGIVEHISHSDNVNVDVVKSKQVITP